MYTADFGGHNTKRSKQVKGVAIKTPTESYSVFICSTILCGVILIIYTKTYSWYFQYSSVLDVI